MMREVEKMLKERGISPTPVRVLVYRCLKDSEQPISLSDLEIRLESVDKSTISRTLSTFRKNHLLHSINDGSGSAKYELCTTHDHALHDDRHVHFRCENCGATICLNSVAVPRVELPEGYIGREISYMISGVCSSCAKKLT